MYLMITAYDVLDVLHVKAQLVKSDGQAEAFTPLFSRAVTLPHQVQDEAPQDTLAIVAECLLDLAYDRM